MNCVEFESVFKSFDETPVLEDITLELPGDVTTAVVGESGSGKSTLLEHINGLLRPDSGNVRVFGQAVAYDQLVEFRRRIGYAVQSVGLFPHLTVFDNIALLARLEAWSEDKIHERIRELFSLLELPDGIERRYPHSLSGGQQQRVGLCRAMMLRPPLLLLDEPFSGVDPITRVAIHEEFLRLQQQEPVSVVLVTHDTKEAVLLAHFLVIIHKGRIMQTGSVEDVLNAPADERVAQMFRT